VRGAEALLLDSSQVETSLFAKPKLPYESQSSYVPVRESKIDIISEILNPDSTHGVTNDTNAQVQDDIIMSS